MNQASQTNKPASKVDTEKLAAFIGRLLADGRCEGVRALDLRGVSPVTDFFVIATGSSDRQMASLAADIKELGRVHGHDVFQTSGTDGGDWIIIDFVDLVVHLFGDEKRHFYDLESLWGDAKSLPWAERTQPGQFAHIGKRPTTTVKDPFEQFE